MLRTDWPKLARRWFWVGWRDVRRGLRWTRRELWRLVREIDVRKPVHAVVIGVTLAGILAPVAAWMAENERYRLTDSAVLTRASVNLNDKLTYDKQKKATLFNGG